MNPGDARHGRSVPSAGNLGRGGTARPGLARSESALSGRPGLSARSPYLEPSQQGGASTAKSKTPAGHPQEIPATSGLPESTQAAIIKRAEKRAKVPHKFRDGCKRFFFSPTGMLKVVRMSCIVAAVVCFFIGQAQAVLIAITIQETCIVLFFIIIYMLTLQHLIICLHWPLLDLINSFISTLFLLVVAIMAMHEKGRRHLFYVGGVLCLTAAILCLIDALVVTKTMRDNVKRALGMETEDSAVAKSWQKPR